MSDQTPAFGVSDFVAVFNQTVSSLYPEVLVYGEIANFRISRGRWVYFDLKDEYSSVKFFGSTTQLPGPIEDGMTVEVLGSPYLHPQYNFSVQIKSVQVTGEGSLTKAFLLLQRKLEQEGLFDISRKRLLPEYPEKVGLIASKESAGYGDFIKIVQKRWPMIEVLEFDVMVQGAEAPTQIVKAINDANQLTLDALVIVRGGGSRDDLVAFDDERVVRAVAGSRAPTLIAIGHERDVVLAELAADVRASTPSNAAEVLVKDFMDELQLLNHAKTVLKNTIDGFAKKIYDDILIYRQSLAHALQLKLMISEQWLSRSIDLIKAHDPYLPLKKGYALAQTSDGKTIRTAKQAKHAKIFDLVFQDDTIKVEEAK